MGNTRNPIVYLLVTIVLLLIGGPLLVAGGFAIFLGFLGLMGVIWTFFKIQETIEESKKDREIAERREKERVQKQRENEERQRDLEEQQRRAVEEEQRAKEEKAKFYEENKRDYINDYFKEQGYAGFHSVDGVLAKIPEAPYLNLEYNLSQIVRYLIYKYSSAPLIKSVSLEEKFSVFYREFLMHYPFLLNYLMEHRPLDNEYRFLFNPFKEDRYDDNVPLIGTQDAHYTSDFYKELKLIDNERVKESRLTYVQLAILESPEMLGWLPLEDRNEEVCRYAYQKNKEMIQYIPQGSPLLEKLRDKKPDEVKLYEKDYESQVVDYLTKKYSYILYTNIEFIPDKINLIVNEISKANYSNELIVRFIQTTFSNGVEYTIQNQRQRNPEYRLLKSNVLWSTKRLLEALDFVHPELTIRKLVRSVPQDYMKNYYHSF